MNQHEFERQLHALEVRERAAAAYAASRKARLNARLLQLRVNRRRHLDKLLGQLDAQRRIPHE